MFDWSYFYNSKVSYFHRCRRVENPGEGVPDVFCQNPKGGSRLSGKIAWGGGAGGPLISGFIAFLLTSVLKFT
jgi:hypothetical protein